MRIIGRFPDERQVGSLVDTLKNEGFDRKDMIISNAGEDRFIGNVEVTENISFIKSERDGLGELASFAEGIKGLRGRTGIVVAIEASKHDSIKIREYMEQSGAVEIIQD